VFDVGLPELLILVLAALFIFGPDRLPQVTAQAVRALRQLRTMASGAREQLTEAIAPDLEDLDVFKDLRELSQLRGLSSLDPRTMITNALLDDSEGSPPPLNGAAGGRNGATSDGAVAHGGDGRVTPPTFDPDAT
jgi:sec-independent protein translocase protein TatB